MRVREVVTYTPFFNDYSALVRLTKTNHELGLTGIFIDGPFPTFPHTSDKSTDGSRELIEKFDNTVLLDAGENYIPHKFNMAMEKAIELGAKYVITIGSDEWIEGDVLSLINNIKFDKPINKVTFMEHKPKSKWNREVTELPRLIVDPRSIRLKENEVHWLYWYNGTLIVTTYFPLAEGIVIHHDDSIRPSWRNQQMEEYQNENYWREQKIISTYRSEIINYNYPPVESKSGGQYYSCGCVYSGGKWYNLCPKHIEVQRKL